MADRSFLCPDPRTPPSTATRWTPVCRAGPHHPRPPASGTSSLWIAACFQTLMRKITWRENAVPSGSISTRLDHISWLKPDLDDAERLRMTRQRSREAGGRDQGRREDPADASPPLTASAPATWCGRGWSGEKITDQARMISCSDDRGLMRSARWLAPSGRHQSINGALRHHGDRRNCMDEPVCRAQTTRFLDKRQSGIFEIHRKPLLACGSQGIAAWCGSTKG